jgi:hypothetical protein
MWNNFQKTFKKYDGSIDVCVSACSLPVHLKYFTVIRFVLVSAKFAYTVLTVNGTIVEAKMCTFTLESPLFVFNRCPICTHDCVSVLFSTSCDETDFCTVWDRQGTLHETWITETPLEERQFGTPGKNVTSESPVYNEDLTQRFSMLLVHPPVLQIFELASTGIEVKRSNQKAG